MTKPATQEKTANKAKQLGLVPTPAASSILSKLPKGTVNQFVSAAIVSFAVDKEEDLKALEVLKAKLNMA